MLGGIKKYPYLCSAKKERDGLCHQRTKTLAGHRALSEFAKKETLRIVPQQFLTIKRDTVQLTYPTSHLVVLCIAHTPMATPPQSLCFYVAIAMLLRCNRYALTLQSLCSYVTIAMLLLCNRYAFTV